MGFEDKSFGLWSPTVFRLCVLPHFLYRKYLKGFMLEFVLYSSSGARQSHSHGAEKQKHILNVFMMLLVIIMTYIPRQTCVQ